MTRKQRIRAVLDTNLFISGLFATGETIAKLQDLWLAGAFELAVSDDILEEVQKTLGKPTYRKGFSLEKKR